MIWLCHAAKGGAFIAQAPKTAPWGIEQPPGNRLAEEGVEFIKVTSDVNRDTYCAIAEEARRLNLPLAFA
jgi:hypothetical protein